MYISQLPSSQTERAAASTATAGKVDTSSTEKLSQLHPSLTKAATRIQGQLDTASSSLSTVGKLKASVSELQQSAQGLGALTEKSTAQEVRTALSRFVTSFNSMISSGKLASSQGGQVDQLSRGMTRAMSADLSKIDTLRQMGVEKTSDGSLRLDASKFDTAYKAAPDELRASLVKLGQLADKAAGKELASGGRIADSMDTLKIRSGELKLQQNSLIKVSSVLGATTSTSSAGTAAYSAGLSVYARLSALS